MNYLKPLEFLELKAFFQSLGYFRSSPGTIIIYADGIRVDRNHCLDLLRANFPEFKDERFKDDSFLIKFLSEPKNLQNIRGRFTIQEQAELTEALDKTVTITKTAEQPIGQETITIPPETQTAGLTAHTGLPSIPTVNTPRFSRMPHVAIPRDTTPAEGAATAKINRLAVQSSLSSSLQKAQNFASPAGPFLKRNMGKVFDGLKGMGGGILGGLGGIGRSSLGAAAPHLGRGFRVGLDSVGRLTQPGGLSGGGIGKLSKSSNKLALGILGGLLLFVLLSGILGAIQGTTPVGEAAPVPGGGDGPPPLPGASTVPAIATDCPIPNGIITCGSKDTPAANGCGHCGAGYPEWAYAEYCGYPGTKYALDIAGNEFQSAYLPRINGNVINWTYRDEEPGKKEAIQKYTGVFSDDFAYQTYYLQLHHTQLGSGNKNAKQSGDEGGKICGGGCNQGHVHVQIGSGGENQNNTAWLDAAQYFCKK